MQMRVVSSVVLLALLMSTAVAQVPAYTIRPGDRLMVSVWGNEELDREIRVLPDGSISYPLVGRLVVAERTVSEVREELTVRISEFIAEAEVSVMVADNAGSQVYVLGNVNTPGAFPLLAPLTVVRALALAGGLNPFADTDDIRIIRGEGDAQRILNVNYDDLLGGRNLQSNHVLMAGDTVLVP